MYVVVCVDFSSGVRNVPIMMGLAVSWFCDIYTTSILANIVVSKAGNYSVSCNNKKGAAAIILCLLS